MSKFRLFFHSSNNINRFLLRLITHVPLLYPIYFLIFLLIKLIFSDFIVIHIAIDLIFLIFSLIIPISHLIFLSVSPESSKNKIFIKEEIQRNLLLLQNFDSIEKNALNQHPDMKLLEIEVNLNKTISFAIRLSLIIGLEVFACKEFHMFFMISWILREIFLLCFAVIYGSNFGFKVYEKLDIKNEKWVNFGVFVISYGIVRNIYQIYIGVSLPFLI